MKIKLGVSLIGLKIQMRRVMIEAELLWREYDRECVITSGTEYTSFEALTEENSLIHTTASLHPFGYALDLRTRYFNDLDKSTIATKLQARLNIISTKYRVILEKTHIHVEFRGMVGCS